MTRRIRLVATSFALLAASVTSALAAPSVDAVAIDVTPGRVELGGSVTGTGTLWGVGDISNVSYVWEVILPDGTPLTIPLTGSYTAGMTAGTGVIPPVALPADLPSDVARDGLHEVQLRVTNPGTLVSSTLRYVVRPPTRRVRPDFENPAATGVPLPPLPAYTEVTLVSGSTCDPSVPGSCPGNGSVLLAGSAFGHGFAGAALADDVDAGVARAAQLLYYDAPGSDPAPTCVADDPQGPGPYCRNLAAFRYRQLIYADKDPTAGTNIVSQLESRDRTMAEFYGNDERARVDVAASQLRAALAEAPFDTSLRNALLDLHRDRLVAELALAQDVRARALEDRLDLTSGWPDTAACVDGVQVQVNSFDTLEAEIASFEETLGLRRGGGQGGMRPALAAYFGFLSDRMGLDTLALDPSAAGDPPFGYYIFQAAAPGRVRPPSQYIDGAGTARPVVVGANGAVGGYGDLVLLFGTLRDYADTVVDLASRLAYRGSEADRHQALALVAEAQGALYVQGTFLAGMFPITLTDPHPSLRTGLQEAVARWRGGLTTLSTTRAAILSGASNPLGFDDEFVMLIDPNADDTRFLLDQVSSYDKFMSIIWDPSAGAGEPLGPLADAVNAYCQASVSYAQYEANQGSVVDEFAAQRAEYNDRLRQIVGEDYGNPVTGVPLDLPAYLTPAENVGSEIWQQVRSVEVARTHVERGAQELRNLIDEIKIEVDRRGAERGIQSAINQVTLRHGTSQARLTEEIGALEARKVELEEAAAAADGVGYEAGFPSGTTVTISLGVAVHLYNAYALPRLEKQKASLEAAKERDQALETAEINDLTGQILDVNSKALIKSLMLRASTLAIEAQENAILLSQEVARLVPMVDEKGRLERKWAEANDDFAERYFADPNHRLREQAVVVAADRAFADAQRWLYFTARALEYKLNAPFSNSNFSIAPPGGYPWTMGTLFSLRTAPELVDFVKAMRATNDANLLSGQRVPHDSLFSVREDGFGLKRFDADRVTELKYVDPPTGDLVTAVEAFRRRLTRLAAPAADPDNGVSAGDTVVRFSTAQQADGGAFFSDDEYSDKIVWMKVLLVGRDRFTNVSVNGSLTSAGVAYLRPQRRGDDGARPDELVGELTSYSTRFGLWDTVGEAFSFQEALRFPVTMYFTPTFLTDPSQVPLTVPENNIIQERSVAATDWRLVLPTGTLGEVSIDDLEDIQIEFNHISRIPRIPQ